eukprot:764358-Hanusia_phi.AAC.2
MRQGDHTIISLHNDLKARTGRRLINQSLNFLSALRGSTIDTVSSQSMTSSSSGTWHQQSTWRSDRVDGS